MVLEDTHDLSDCEEFSIKYDGKQLYELLGCSSQEPQMDSMRFLFLDSNVVVSPQELSMMSQTEFLNVDSLMNAELTTTWQNNYEESSMEFYVKDQFHFALMLNESSGQSGSLFDEMVIFATAETLNNGQSTETLFDLNSHISTSLTTSNLFLVSSSVDWTDASSNVISFKTEVYFDESSFLGNISYNIDTPNLNVNQVGMIASSGQHSISSVSNW